MTTKTKILLASGTLLSRSTLIAFEGEENKPAAFDFPETVDDIQVVPERARGLYTEKDGKWQYTDVGALKNSLTHARNEREAARREAAAAAEWKALGKTPEEIKALLDAEREREEKKLTEEGDWTALRTQMETNHTNALSEKDKRINKLMTTLEKALIHDSARAALADEEIGGNPLFLLPAINGRVKLEESEDGFTTVVLRADGTPQLNSDNKPATLKDLFLEFKAQPEWAGAFKGLGQSGGGASGDQQRGGGAPGNLKRSEMTPVAKAAFIKEHGQEKYLALPM